MFAGPHPSGHSRDLCPQVNDQHTWLADPVARVESHVRGSDGTVHSKELHDVVR